VAGKRPLLALSIPLALLACVFGHVAGYAAAGAGAGGQAVHAGERAVHGYLAYGPLFLALCASIAAAALGVRVAGRLRGHLSPVPMALIGPFAFLVQELAERLAAGLPVSAVLELAVLAGLLAQVPCAVLAYRLARWLLRAADVLAAALGRSGPFAVSPPGLPRPARDSAPPRPLHRFTGHGRAPPLSAAFS
jgi:hypothetical protein